jgi:hypothetical protein
VYEAQTCRAQAERYGQLAQQARSSRDRDRLLRMKRSYALMARSAEFGMALDDLITR